MHQNQTLVHIGYHKTATSYLQDRIFEAFPTLFNRVKQRAIFNHIIYPNHLSFEENFDAITDFVNSNIEAGTHKNQLTIFSNERLSGGPHSGGFDSVEIANRLKKLIPNAKILIVVREQNSMIYSSYNQYIRAVGSCSLEEYMNPKTLKNKDLFHYDFFKYDRLLKYYIELFGKENVLCLPSELLSNNHDYFIEKILSFLSLNDEQKQYILENMNRNRSNESLMPIEISIKRIFNPFILKNHKNLGNLLYSRWMIIVYKILIFLVRKFKFKKLNSAVKNKRQNFIKKNTSQKYQVSNSNLQKLINIDLEKFAYKTNLQ